MWLAVRRKEGLCVGVWGCGRACERERVAWSGKSQAIPICGGVSARPAYCVHQRV